MRFPLGVALLLLVHADCGLPTARAEDAPPAGVFSAWDAETFARAKRERRVIVLMVSTTWCHWCHVMKRETYGSADVQRALKQGFLPVLVDADARPDLSERFRHYRWPTTAFLTPDAKPILAIRGYRNPSQFLALLVDVQQRVKQGGPYPGFDEPAKPTGTRYTTEGKSLRQLRERIVSVLDRHYDPEAAGWGRKQKYPVPGPVEHGLYLRVVEGAPGPAFKRSLATLASTEQLIDREWGGVYQYSLEGRWDRWHPEKIMTVNAGALLTYAQAYHITRDARWLRDARDVVRWLTRFMQAPGGGFRGTQDADAPRLAGEQFYRLSAKGRLPYGVPHVSPRMHTRANAEAVLGLLALYRATGDMALYGLARSALERIVSTAMDKAGWVRHRIDAAAPAPIYLVDQATLGRALLAMDQAERLSVGTYQPAGPRHSWIAQAKRVAAGMEQALGDERSGGFFDVARDAASAGVFATRLRSLEPNATAARFLLDLSARTGATEPEARALRVLVAVGTSDTVRNHWRHGAGLLLATEQAVRPFARIELVGDPTNAAFLDAAKRIQLIARAHPNVWWHASVGASEQAPTIHVCGPGFCSEPLTDLRRVPLAVQAVLRSPPAR